MRISASSSLQEVGFCVRTALDEVGVTAVLSGGGAATFHAPEAIQSFDLDFILAVYGHGPAAAGALSDLGFRREGHDYCHAESRYQLEFPPGPLAVGDELIESWDTPRSGAFLLHVISPTDSCRDRLAAFYHFKDRSALAQALAIYRNCTERLELDRVQVWSEREGHRHDFEEFRALATS